MNRYHLTAVLAGFVCALLAIVVPVVVVVTNATERMHACVDSGGSYVHVPETTVMECRR